MANRTGLCLVFILNFLGFWQLSAREISKGSDIYLQNCASCHESPSDERIPTRKMLSELDPELITQALAPGGRMEFVGRHVLEIERRLLAEYLTGKKIVFQPDDTNRCSEKISAKQLVGGSDSNVQWNGWGADPTNSRHQTIERAKLTPDQITKLKVKWSFGFFGGEPRGQPTVMGDILFTSSSLGKVYALNRKTGCVYWSFSTSAEMKHAFSFSRLKIKGRKADVVFFGDVVANVYALDLSNGALLWKTSVENDHNARITGSPLLVGAKLFVPVSSTEESATVDPQYPCCSFRGSMAALDAASGKIIWQTFTITGPSKEVRKQGPDGNKLVGPAGGGIWSTPTYDSKLKRLYVGTGNDYSLPTTKNTDAILAFDIANGKIVWSNQLIPDDAFNVACVSTKLNCPKAVNPNSDRGFGSSTILRTLKGGKRILLAASKGGQVYGLDPDSQGKLLWQAKAGDGGILGGIEWGITADEEAVYAGVVDYLGKQGAGILSAFRISDGELLWSKKNGEKSCKEKIGCTPAISGALTSIPGVVFAGTVDGFLRAFATKDGSLLWQYATRQDFKTVNGIPAKGGSINATGPVVVDGMVYVTSGYGYPNLASMTGNVLVAFSL